MFVSVICPSFKRHRFIPFLIEQFNNQNYPKEKLELIIFDDTPSPYPFEIKDNRIRYIHDNSKHYMLWEKRNRLNELAQGEIIVCMDDDDFSMHHRIEKSIEILTKRQNVLLCGSSILYIYDIFTNQLHLFKPFKNKILLNGTFAYKRTMLERYKYLETKNNNLEEITFTKNYTVPLMKIDYNDTIVCINHHQNTVDKSNFCISKTLSKDTIDNFNLQTMYNVLPIVYWINLKKSTDRYDNMVKQFEYFRFHERIEGIEEPCIKYNTKKYTKSQMGCLCSHLNAMKKSIEDNRRDYAIICEDDVYLKTVKHLHEIIFYYLRSAPQNWDILQLYSIKQSRNLKMDCSSLLKWEKWNKRNFSTLIYIIRKSYAKKLLNLSEKINERSVGLLADEFIYSKGNAYSVVCPYFEDDLQFDSLIDTSHRAFHETNKQKIKSSLDTMDLKYPFRNK